MVEQQTLAGLLGAATAGASIKLGESMTSLEMAAKSPDLPDSVRERIEAALDTLETGSVDDLVMPSRLQQPASMISRRRDGQQQ